MQGVVNSRTVLIVRRYCFLFSIFWTFASPLRWIYEVPSVFSSFGRFVAEAGFFRFEKLIYFFDDFHELLRVLFVHRLLAQFVPAF